MTPSNHHNELTPDVTAGADTSYSASDLADRITTEEVAGHWLKATVYPVDGSDPHCFGMLIHRAFTDEVASGSRPPSIESDLLRSDDEVANT